jgi:hypothetical protein
MPKKTIVGEFGGSRFIVENTWFSGAKLFHGHELIATNNNMIAIKKGQAVMSAKVIIGEVERLVEVFAYAIFTVKLQIRIDGKIIAGDLF